MAITSVANPKVKQVIKWRDKARERKQDQVYLAEGVKMFEEAPAEEILEVYISETLMEKLKQGVKTEILKKLEICPFLEVSDDVMARMADTQTPQGIMTVLRQHIYKEETLLNARCPLIVVAEDLQDAGNLGTILRTGEGAGVTGIVISSRTVDIYNPKTIRATMGSIYRVPFLYVDDVCEFAEKLAKRGIHTYAAHLLGKESYDRQPLKEPAAFFIGNEGNGLSGALAKRAEKLIRIPMEGKVESLNAGIAASLLLYEAHRQRHQDTR